MKVITLTGNATKDIEIRYRTNGKAIETAIVVARSDLKIELENMKRILLNFIVLKKSGILLFDRFKGTYNIGKFGIKSLILQNEA
ncbi:MAG TPA: hypothetical protein VIG98_00905 [Bacillus sp. (in: firmicutes)]|jgi:hypothetical protein